MFFFEHESNESNESCKCVALALLRTINSKLYNWLSLRTPNLVSWSAKPTILHSSFFILHSSFYQQPQAVTLANARLIHEGVRVDTLTLTLTLTTETPINTGVPAGL